MSISEFKTVLYFLLFCQIFASKNLDNNCPEDQGPMS